MYTSIRKCKILRNKVFKCVKFLHGRLHKSLLGEIKEDK